MPSVFVIVWKLFPEMALVSFPLRYYCYAVTLKSFFIAKFSTDPWVPVFIIELSFVPFSPFWSGALESPSLRWTPWTFRWLPTDSSVAPMPSIVFGKVVAPMARLAAICWLLISLMNEPILIVFWKVCVPLPASFSSLLPERAEPWLFWRVYWLWEIWPLWLFRAAWDLSLTSLDTGRILLLPLTGYEPPSLLFELSCVPP